MATTRQKNFFEDLFDSLSKNEYLLELYNELLRNYTRYIFGRNIEKLDDKKVTDLLRFAEILANSQDGKHKIWSQQIVALLNKLNPKNKEIEDTKRYVLLSCTNFKGLDNKLTPTGDFLDDISNEIIMDSFKIPNTENDHFFSEQKEIYESFQKETCSYSAPTSMGKSFIMRIFIKDQIKKGSNKNYAIIVPTKALISEVKKSIIEDMASDLIEHDYRIITAVGDLALTIPHKFIYVMTPERMLYLINTKPDLKIDYLFIDEAHKLSSKDTRSPLYYDLLDKISTRKETPYIFFSSPNIPNPEIYLKLIKNANLENKIRVSFSPVSQIKYLIDLKNGGLIRVFNDFSKEFIQIGNRSSAINLNSIIDEVGKNRQNLIYCSSIDKTMKAAKNYAQNLPDKHNPDLDKLSKDIATEIHKDYFLVNMIKKGVAFHVGYLPANIRSQIEKLYKEGVINHLFCTSTLIEGVNLPADNLFITSYKAGTSSFDEVSFRNLIGRVGRIKFNLFGNVFLITLQDEADRDKSPEKYSELLKTDIPEQQLSADEVLRPIDKQRIVKALVHEDYEIMSKPDDTTANKFEIMRKFQLILKNDIQSGNTSAVSESFKSQLSNEEINAISSINKPDNKSIDISPDQYRNLSDYINDGNSYPTTHFSYDEIVAFLEELSRIFKWKVYEKKTLGHWDKLNYTLTHIKYYSTLLLHWMQGDNLAYIIRSAIEYKEKHPDTGVWLNSHKIEEYYNPYDEQHKNYVIADTLNSLDKVILFKISNYFREFSTEYKKVNHIDGRFPNDWYEYVEYGTTDDIIITLQQCGFEREQAQYIKSHGYLDLNTPSSVATFTIKKEEILKSKDEDVVNQAKEALINVPELFK